jgi:DNA-binding NtrC family response regulator
LREQEGIPSVAPVDDTQSHPAKYSETLSPKPGAGIGPDAGRRSYLLVVVDGTSSKYDLPLSGVVSVGRAPEADLRVNHPSVSRRHATIRVDPDATRIVDAESHNGTRVNGELLVGTRALRSGDVLSVGDVVMVVHAAPRQPSRAALDEAAWMRRVAEELERAITYRRGVAVIAVAGVPRAQRGEALERARGQLRGIDLTGIGDDGYLMLLCPELEADGARDATSRIATAVCEVAADARFGCAVCPIDACDADSLVSAAETAARHARPGRVARPAEATTRLELGDRTVVLAAPAMLRVFELIERLAASELPILITGETGVGKEKAAWAVHYFSSRRDKPFVAINCAALQDTLIESELFGYQKGAFSGANANTPGLLESAAGGTVFLDEIGELSAVAQAKVLRALDSGCITRIGDRVERDIDVRIVAATNRDVEAEIVAGRFRQDLFFRLGATVVLPPLRDRRAEIPVLAREFLAQACAQMDDREMELSPDAIRCFLTYDWPGNVRELRTVIDYVAAATQDSVIGAYHLPDRIAGEAPGSPPSGVIAILAELAPPDLPRTAPLRNLADEIRELEQRRMTEALAAADGVKSRAAELIGMPVRTFSFKLKQYGIGRD